MNSTQRKKERKNERDQMRGHKLYELSLHSLTERRKNQRKGEENFSHSTLEIYCFHSFIAFPYANSSYSFHFQRIFPPENFILKL